ncbi:MAG: hypothetical protein IPJ30_18030 [Acidobacteria bacterium]|nr:hypothetical protein [Acidobacteriota bacterium]
MLLTRELICLCLWFSMIYTQQPWLWECGKAAFWLFQAIVGIEGKRFLFFLNFHMSGISIAFFGFDQTGRHRSPPGHTSGAPPDPGASKKVPLSIQDHPRCRLFFVSFCLPPAACWRGQALCEQSLSACDPVRRGPLIHLSGYWRRPVSRDFFP